MYIVIVGAGNVGRYLAELLLEEDHDVIAVDKEKEVCQKIANELEINAVQGDATDPKILQQVEVHRADAVVALTSSDETNMVSSLIAKELGAKTVATRIERIEYDEGVLKKLGIDIVIHPKAAAASYILELLTKPEVLDLAFISRGSALIMEIEVKDKSAFIGKKVKEIEHPAGSSIIAVVKGEEVEIPMPETRIKKGDKLLVLTKKESAEKVRKTLR